MNNNAHDLLCHYELIQHIIHILMDLLKDIFILVNCSYFVKLEVFNSSKDYFDAFIKVFMKVMIR
jgi:hypothetical protein